ncbi:hypothetical protein HZB96_05070 [Candidatus Gottesmanbacteria bacterium]|nr:hypothetical protein [Candidatus Gottesmanbacteria bacterium]
MNINWPDVITRLMGDGIIITAVGFLIQYLIHKQIIEFEKRKRSDYFIGCNYNKLLEMGIKLEQLLVHFWKACNRAMQPEAIAIPDLWRFKFSIKDAESEQISLSEFLHRYSLFIPEELGFMLVEMYKAYKNKEYEAAKTKSVESSQWIKKMLGIECGKIEIGKIFSLISEET